MKKLIIHRTTHEIEGFGSIIVKNKDVIELTKADELLLIALTQDYGDFLKNGIFQYINDEQEPTLLTLSSGVKIRKKTPQELNAPNGNTIWIDVSFQNLSTYYTGPHGVLGFPRTPDGNFTIGFQTFFDEAKTNPVLQLTQSFIFIGSLIEPLSGKIIQQWRPKIDVVNGSAIIPITTANFQSGRWSLLEDNFLPITFPGLGIFQCRFIHSTVESFIERRAFEFDIYCDNF